MDDDASRNEIARLEDRIEALAVSIERCRKISIAARIAVGAGLAWMTVVLAGFATFDPTTFFGAMTAALGGVVLLGSNATTWDQFAADRDAAAAMRAQLIGQIDLRVVNDAPPTIH